VVRTGMDQLGDVGRYIREQRRQAELSLRKLASQAGVSNPYLSQIERGLRQPSARILKDIAKALRISAETLYVRAGILDEDADATDLEVAILRDPHLNERQRQVLIDVYRSFRADGAATAAPAGDASNRKEHP
jgi:transcriptional regulator with XRE-family HTH domain